MKLSFSLPSKPSFKRVPLSTTHGDSPDDEDTKEYITDFNGTTKIQTNPRPRFTIPPKENEWRPDKKSTIDSEYSTADIRGNNLSSGLNLRGPSESINKDNTRKVSRTDEIGLQRLRDAVRRLPEHGGFDEVPVGEFGAAYLSGYGWYEGRGIGKNAIADVKVKQFKNWTHRKGLGFVEREKVSDHFVGKDVRIVAGKNVGLKGRIEKLDSDSVVLKLANRVEQVRISVTDIADLGSMEEEKCLKEFEDGVRERDNIGY